jgi:ribosome maturation factor RimP
MSTTQSERLRALLEPLVGKAGLDLEDVTLSASGRRRQLLVVVDAEDGVQLDTVAAVSRSVSQALDESDVMGETEYVLEITSPGTDRPLTEPRHFRRNEGRLVKLSLKERGELIARIMAVDETGLDLEVPGVKGRKPKPARADFAEIAKARVEVEFNRKAGEPDGDLGDHPDGDHPDDDGSDVDSSDIDETTEEA